MAIIYTYPKLASPQGNELIVVTDVNNSNATRLITIASIAALVPGGGGGGCSTAITGIQADIGNYAAPLCNEVTFIGQGMTISADQATSSVTFAVDQVSIPCATAEETGGIIVSGVEINEESFEPAEEGNYYPIQINKDCEAAVRIPESSTYLLPCALPTVLGGVKALVNTTVQEPPSIAASGNYYPIEVLSAQAVQVNDCRAVVRVPEASVSCATSEDIGGIKVAEGFSDRPVQPSEEGINYPVQVDDECRASVRVPIATARKVGFSPLEIYSGEDNVASGREFVQAVCDVDITIDAVDYFVLSAGTVDAPTIAIYDGELTNTPAATLLYSGTNTAGSTVGINTHVFSTPLTLTAGQRIVIYNSIPAEFELLGKAHGQFPGDQFVAVGSATPSSTAPADLESGVEGLNSTGKKICLHFYEK
jgi:hypothetical protein